jgi:hypothetical protein
VSITRTISSSMSDGNSSNSRRPRPTGKRCCHQA